MNMAKYRVMAVSFIILAMTAGFCLALEPINKTFFGGVAIEGYDPVSYFTVGKPTKGMKEYSYDWMNATWRFASKENLELFKAEPEKYAPQYGGYCAWAVSQGKTAGIDPQAWKIVNGKLYLNYNRSVQEQWEQDIPGNIRKADENWPKLLTK